MRCVWRLGPPPDAAQIAYYGLHSLQHRGGQEGAGIVVSDGRTLKSRKDLGLVTEVFTAGGRIERLVGSAAIGHVRYSLGGLKRL